MSQHIFFSSKDSGHIEDGDSGVKMIVPGSNAYHVQKLDRAECHQAQEAEEQEVRQGILEGPDERVGEMPVDGG